ncbi:LuxR C-terminal-related transcriptional regulator [Dawidia soli]|uniref:PAS domain-containing protein n=1 Tax=Dawidia soli TaxID=2782352 RepID=A0AAP2DA93_9BACT|nr:LuxR C-terminal-related transcriptional regulator [Dawidia soli]MBT1687356.1 PAS domain-containing protein [Dawidia soli]
MEKRQASDEKASPSRTPAKEFFQTETDLQTIMGYTHMLEQFYPDKVIQICRQHHEAAFYVSKNCKEFWGIAAKRMKFLTMSEYLDLIHPEDIASMSGVQRLMDEHSAGYDPSQLRFTLIYRMKGPDGQYHAIEDEKVVIKTSSGNYAHFCTYTKTAEKVTATLDVYQLFNSKKVRIKRYILRDRQEDFSAREMDIIKLIDKGFSNAEISDQLSLSIFTVKNHKQRLFRKTHVKNTMELLRFARPKNIV